MPWRLATRAAPIPAVAAADWSIIRPIGARGQKRSGKADGKAAERRSGSRLPWRRMVQTLVMSPRPNDGQAVSVFPQPFTVCSVLALHHPNYPFPVPPITYPDTIILRFAYHTACPSFELHAITLVTPCYPDQGARSDGAGLPHPSTCLQSK